MTFKSRYTFEDELYLRTDSDQCMRIVTGVYFKPGDVVIYELTCGTETTEHYEFELTDKPNVLAKTR